VRERAGGRGAATEEERGKRFGLHCTARKGKPEEEDEPRGGSRVAREQ
jgi:hypothetical protein